MKRTWEPTITSTYGVDAAQQLPPEPPWGAVIPHPYASAYSSIPNPFEPTLHNPGDPYDPALYGAQTLEGAGPADKKPRLSDYGLGNNDGDEDDEDDEDDDGEDDDDARGGGKGTSASRKARNRKDALARQKLTRGSRACISCRKIKMRCIPDETGGPGAPCRRCRAGGHECTYEESNRGKRSTRKNEAIAMRSAKMEAALRGIGAALSILDQPALNAFSTALHSATSDPEVINLITSHTAPAAVPTLAVAMDRVPYKGPPDVFSGQKYEKQPVRGEDAAHHQPPLSPRLHSLPDNVLSPLGLLAEASLQNTDGKKQYQQGQGSHRPSPLSLGDGRAPPHGRTVTAPSVASAASTYRMMTSDIRGGEAIDTARQAGQGVASHDYFKPGASIYPYPGTGDDRVPELLTLVSREEIGELFDIYYDHMSIHVPLLYREFHTPDLVLQRSQFLCTVMCAIASRHYIKRSDLHAQLSAYAKRLAFEVPARGYKSVEVCQAYLLLSVWTLGPEKTFEQDRTWLMLGMAIRMATDLNLHRKSVTSELDTDEGRARDLEIINRERCWLHCFVLDRSISSQMGKPYTLREDYTIRIACEASWHQQRFSLPSDRALAAYVVLQQIMSRAIDSIYSSTTTVSGLRHDCDYMLIVRSAHEELRRWLTEWSKADSAEALTMSGKPVAVYDCRAQFYFAYHSLVLYSFGLENAIARAKMDISFFLTNVYEAATRVCTVIRDDFLPTGYLPYLPDTNFVMCSYALLSLLKLLKPELRPFHDSEEVIFKLVSDMADIFEDIAADPSHQPAIYAAFIREIVRKTRDARKSGSQPPTRAVSPQPTSDNFQMANGAPQPLQETMFDPQLLEQTAQWQPGDLLPSSSGGHFAFIPQGGDMMILPSAAGPSDSIVNSPSAAFLPNFGTGATPQTAPTQGWAEYLPTFMSADGFDGWDGSMLLPGFGRGQITLGGGLLHSQFGSGIITPANHTPTGSRAGSRAPSRAQTPSRS